jgi:GNAT superfamily N-acetyltransferase
MSPSSIPAPSKYFRVEVSDPTPNFINLFKTLVPDLPEEIYTSAVSYGTKSCVSKFLTHSRIGHFNDLAVGVAIVESGEAGDRVHSVVVLPAYQGLGVEEELVKHLKEGENEIEKKLNNTHIRF